MQAQILADMDLPDGLDDEVPENPFDNTRRALSEFSSGRPSFGRPPNGTLPLNTTRPPTASDGSEDKGKDEHGDRGRNMTKPERHDMADKAFKLVSFFCAGDLRTTCGLGNATTMSCPEKYMQACAFVLQRHGDTQQAVPLRLPAQQHGRAGGPLPPAAPPGAMAMMGMMAPPRRGGPDGRGNPMGMAGAFRAVIQCVAANYTRFSAECKAALGEIVPPAAGGNRTNSTVPKQAALDALGVAEGTYAGDAAPAQPGAPSGAPAGAPSGAPATAGSSAGAAAGAVVGSLLLVGLVTLAGKKALDVKRQRDAAAGAAAAKTDNDLCDKVATERDKTREAGELFGAHG
jgi:hypothetical protein